MKEFDAEVVGVKDDKFVVLNRTAFYPNAGGQPYDTGKFIKNNEEFPVVYAGKFSGRVSHEVSKGGLSAGDKIRGVIDWKRRYLFMRYHTACHILSRVIYKEAKAVITGNQIGEKKTRIDFSLENFNKDEIKDYAEKANMIVGRGLAVNIKFLPRDEAFRIPAVVRLKMQIPQSIARIRIVEIENFDQQACGGTHVKNTSEVGHIEIVKAENKGKDNRRIYFKIGD